jgi:hypothetical protein
MPRAAPLCPALIESIFYVNGWPLSSKEFLVEDDRDLARLLRRHLGSIIGLVSGREIALEINFRPYADGSLQGDLTIREPGYGQASIEGRINGNHLEFHCRIGPEGYHFRGWREGDRLSGVYKLSSSGAGGRWSVKITGAPPS